MKDFREKDTNNGNFMLKGSNASSIVLKNEPKLSDMRTPQKDANKSNNK